ncbi:xaa-Arg dipeptidase-like isoform X2 [Apostichopus japonicus]|uniref:xaa-Arg dipeptidase-like isoform X2 n=1 Tax=Stichopus japonicus TaxID=307972 RepID=UPI003AB8799B
MESLWQMVSPFGSMKDEAKTRIDNAAAELNALSHDLWSHPENPYNEVHAHDLLTTFLENDGFEVERNFILPTAFRATYGYDGGRAVAVMAEYDALPNIGHASGHNLVAESAIGVALGVKAALESMEQKVQKGKIIVFGCPSNAGAGKQKLINAGVFFGISASLMVSPFNKNILKPRQEALEKVRYKFHGLSANASLAPWDGRNALDAAVQCYSSIAAMRKHLRPSIKVHGVFVNGGNHPGVVPDQTELLFHIEASTTAELQPAVKKCEDCAIGAASATQCTVEIEYGSYFAELKTNSHLSLLYKKHCNELGLKFLKEEQNLPVGIATDMGNVSFVTPSIHVLYDINTAALNNTKEFALAAGAPEAQKATLLQAKALALTAIDLLQPGGSKLIDSINKEFQKLTPPSEVVGQIPMNQPADTPYGNKGTLPREAVSANLQNGPPVETPEPAREAMPDDVGSSTDWNKAADLDDKGSKAAEGNVTTDNISEGKPAGEGSNDQAAEQKEVPTVTVN